MRVVMIAGGSYSGSTLLDILLGAAPGAIAVGELEAIWNRAREDHPCSCGAGFHDCPFWREVVRTGFGGWDNAMAERYLREQWAAVLAGPPGLARLGLRRHSHAFAAFGETRRRLYAAIGSVSGASTVVDSSKSPNFNYWLGRVPGLDVSTVHIIRDPRAVAFSFRRREGLGAGKRVPGRWIRAATRQWNWAHIEAETGYLFTGRQLRVRYEDLTRSPKRTLACVLRFASLPPTSLADLTRDREHHLVGGNKIRFDRGDRAIRVDDEWRRALPRRDNARVVLRTLPLMAAYRYAPWDGLLTRGSS